MSNIDPEDNPLLNRPEASGVPSHLVGSSAMPSGNSAAADTGSAGPSASESRPSAGQAFAGQTLPGSLAGASAAADRSATVASPSGSSYGRGGGLRETLEAIIIALILAFTGRTFLVEAFVIPTGSMAPTLNGAHVRVICPKCGYQFSVDANVDQQWARVAPNEWKMLRMSTGELTDPYGIAVANNLQCPNCHNVVQIDRGQLPDPYKLRQVVNSDDSGTTTAAFPYVYNGDRILVMRYLYWFSKPKRWDVIVFKEPMQGQENYIKRLIGLPGETIEIVDGDVFVNGLIARKPPAVEKAMLQLVYDNDYYPTDAGKMRPNDTVWTTPWVGVVSHRYAGDWATGGPVIKFAAPQPDTRGRLSFKQRSGYLTNNIGYDDSVMDPLVRGRDLVGDLYLRTVWTSSSPDGSISMVLGKADNRYRVALLHDGTLALGVWAKQPRRFNTIAPAACDFVKHIGPLRPNHPYAVAMSNVDHQVRFWLDGCLVLQYSPKWTRNDAADFVALEKQNGPEVPRVYIDVTGAAVLRHVKLMRDIYYTQMRRPDPANPTVTFPGTGCENHPITLKAGQYFALGDNSNYSGDSRYWYTVEPALADLHLPLGVVPQRYLLGKAFMVYWPAGFRISNHVNWALIPNVGRMRFIR